MYWCDYWFVDGCVEGWCLDLDCLLDWVDDVCCLQGLESWSLYNWGMGECSENRGVEGFDEGGLYGVEGFDEGGLYWVEGFDEWGLYWVDNLNVRGLEGWGYKNFWCNNLNTCLGVVDEGGTDIVDWGVYRLDSFDASGDNWDVGGY